MRAPIIKVAPSAERCDIEIDDAANPEFWLNVQLSRDEIVRILKEMNEDRECKDRHEDLGGNAPFNLNG